MWTSQSAMLILTSPDLVASLPPGGLGQVRVTAGVCWDSRGRLFYVAEPKVVEMGQVTRVALAAPDHLGREVDRLRKQLLC